MAFVNKVEFSGIHHKYWLLYHGSDMANIPLQSYIASTL